MQSSSRKKHRLQITVGCMAGALTFALLLKNLSAPLLLTAKATRVDDVPPGTIECFRLPSQAVLVLQKQGSAVRANWLHPTPANRTSLAVLNTTLAAVKPLNEWHVSPDGRWLLWTGERPAPVRQIRHNLKALYNQYRVFATALDGSRQIERQQGGNVTWLPDSSGWTRWMLDQGSPYLQSQTLDSPQLTSSRLPHVGPRQTRIAGQRYAILESAVVLGSRQDGTVLLRPKGWMLNRRTAMVSRNNMPIWDAVAPLSTALAIPAVAREYKIPIPEGMQMEDAELSMQGDRLAWKLYGMQIPPLQRWLWQHAPWLHLGLVPDNVISVWVSGADGSDLREIGRVKALPVEDWPHQLSSLHWTPDGKHVSFLYQAKFYMVPVD